MLLCWLLLKNIPYTDIHSFLLHLVLALLSYAPYGLSLEKLIFCINNMGCYEYGWAGAGEGINRWGKDEACDLVKKESTPETGNYSLRTGSRGSRGLIHDICDFRTTKIECRRMFVLKSGFAPFDCNEENCDVPLYLGDIFLESALG